MEGGLTWDIASVKNERKPGGGTNSPIDNSADLKIANWQSRSADRHRGHPWPFDEEVRERERERASGFTSKQPLPRHGQPAVLVAGVCTTIVVI